MAMKRMSDKKIKQQERELQHQNKTIPSVGNIYKAKIIRSKRYNDYERRRQKSLLHLDGKHLLFLEWSEQPNKEDRRSKDEGMRFLIVDNSDYVWIRCGYWGGDYVDLQLVS